MQAIAATQRYDTIDPALRRCKRYAIDGVATYPTAVDAENGNAEVELKATQ